MLSQIPFRTILTTLLFLTYGQVEGAEVLCPAMDQVAPCSCYDGLLECIGAEVTQNSIDRLFSAVRAANDVSPIAWLDLPLFRLRETYMNSLNLAPLMNCRFVLVDITINYYLAEIVGPLQNTSVSVINERLLIGGKRAKDFLGGIETLRLDIHLNYQLADSGLQDTFKYFSPQTLTELNLSNNNLTGSGVGLTKNGDEEIEFLPDLSSLVNLRSIDLSYNQITKFAGGQFRHLSQLIFFNAWSNKVTELGENAFIFDEDPDDPLEGRRYIGLQSNLLTNSKIHPENGLGADSNEYTLDFGGNKFTTLTIENFGTFFSNHNNGTSYVEFMGNFFICDDRMKWLKDARAEWEYRANGISCENDPGQTIFTTELV